LRSKKTNLLQFSVLISGIVFILMGLSFYISPMKVISFFAENISENWFDLVRDHELVAPLYYLLRGFSAILFTSGFIMIMPLFDPLKYRGVVWFNGVLFPLMASVLLGKVSFFYSTRKSVTGDAAQGDYQHLILLVTGIVFFVIFLSNFVMLLITRSDAKLGRE